jgi:hypothetical protein
MNKKLSFIKFVHSFLIIFHKKMNNTTVIFVSDLWNRNQIRIRWSGWHSAKHPSIWATSALSAAPSAAHILGRTSIDLWQSNPAYLLLPNSASAAPAKQRLPGMEMLHLPPPPPQAQTPPPGN